MKQGQVLNTFLFCTACKFPFPLKKFNDFDLEFWNLDSRISDFDL